MYAKLKLDDGTSSDDCKEWIETERLEQELPSIANSWDTSPALLE
jgi:hypothetical protein